jgi:pimeloyl-ACP methyl ester carboxylesterase
MSARPMPEVPGVRHRFVAANGLRLHVAEAGPEDGGGRDPVLMLHGWPQHWYLWRDLIPAFAEHRRVIAPDLRGFGWSEAPAGRRYDKEAFATDTIALLDALEIERVDLMGHDWGGWTGFLVALFHPERVGRYLACNITPPWAQFNRHTTLSMWRFWYAATLALPVAGTRIAQAIGRAAGTGKRRIEFPGWAKPDYETFLGQLAEPERAYASSQTYRSFLWLDLPRALSPRYRRRRLTVPTLLLYGAEDPVIRPHHLEGWQPYADDMRVEHVPGIGHFIVDEVPDRVAARAREHFDAQVPVAA